MEFWNYLNNEPTQPGWYAVLMCFDSEEEAYPCAAEWGGTDWTCRGVLYFGGQAMPSEAEARALALQHDPRF